MIYTDEMLEQNKNDRQSGGVYRFTKLSRRSPGEITDLNDAALSATDPRFTAIKTERPAALEKPRKSVAEIASDIVNAFEHDPEVTKGVGYRLPETREALEAMLQDFILLPSNYSRRYQYLVAKKYQETPKNG